MSLKSEFEKECFEPHDEMDYEHQLNFFTAPYPIMSDEERESKYKIASLIPRPKARIINFKSLSKSNQPIDSILNETITLHENKINDSST